MESTKQDTKDKKSREPDNWICDLKHYGVLNIHGADALTFLQGQTTCDFKQLKSDNWTMGALCNPKGRVISVFDALATGSGFLLIIPEAMLTVVSNRLKMFILRSDVTLTDDTHNWRLSGFSVNSSIKQKINLPSGNNLSSEKDCYILSKHGLTGGFNRYLLLSKADSENRKFQQLINLGLTCCSGEKWDEHEIRIGIPTITEQTTESFTPHMLNLDLLNAVSFEKGCYTGQEVVARTQHLGTLKRRMFGLIYSTQTSPEPGTQIYSTSVQTQESVGQIVRSIQSGDQTMILAVLQKSALGLNDLIIDNPEPVAVSITNSFDPEIPLT